MTARDLAAPPRPYVILDRDGTLNAERHHLSDPAQLRVLPGVIEGLTSLHAHGIGRLVVTNQSVIGRGMVTPQGLDAIHDRLIELLRAGGASLDGIYACPHLPDAGCDCRKPRTALVERAAADHGFDPSRSVVIGDSVSDIHLGQNVRALTILVTTGHGRATLESGLVAPDRVCDGFGAAARLAIAHLVS